MIIRSQSLAETRVLNKQYETAALTEQLYMVFFPAGITYNHSTDLKSHSERHYRKRAAKMRPNHVLGSFEQK